MKNKRRNVKWYFFVSGILILSGIFISPFMRDYIVVKAFELIFVNYTYDYTPDIDDYKRIAENTGFPIDEENSEIVDLCRQGIRDPIYIYELKINREISIDDTTKFDRIIEYGDDDFEKYMQDIIEIYTEHMDKDIFIDETDKNTVIFYKLIGGIRKDYTYPSNDIYSEYVIEETDLPADTLYVLYYKSESKMYYIENYY